MTSTVLQNSVAKNQLDRYEHLGDIVKLIEDKLPRNIVFNGKKATLSQGVVDGSLTNGSDQEKTLIFNMEVGDDDSKTIYRFNKTYSNNGVLMYRTSSSNDWIYIGDENIISLVIKSIYSSLQAAQAAGRGASNVEIAENIA